MFRKKGNDLPKGQSWACQAYSSAIADALRTELGQSHRATKTLMRWTGASDRTAKNWLGGSCGPSGIYLIQLARESDTVLATILGLAGRNQHMVGADLLTIKTALIGAIELVDGLLRSDPSPG
jgi:hypothetical protein